MRKDTPQRGNASVAKPRRKTIRPGLIESLVRSIAEGLVDPKMQGPNFSWLETFPSLGARLTEGQLGLGYFKVHPHHLEEIKRKAQEVAEEYARRQPGAQVGSALRPEEVFRENIGRIREGNLHSTKSGSS